MTTAPTARAERDDWDERLARWAEWRRTPASGGLGYPDHAAWLSLRSGCYGSVTPALMESEGPETDRCVSMLPAIHRDAVVEHYCHTATVEEHARRCGVCVRAYYHRLARAFALLPEILAQVQHRARTRLDGPGCG